MRFSILWCWCLFVFSAPAFASSYLIENQVCNGYAGGSLGGQSFVLSGASGLITELEIVSDQSHANATLYFGEGEGFGGPILHSQAISFTASADGTDFRSFVIDVPLALQAGETYTWWIEIPAGNVGLCISQVDTYALGAHIGPSGTAAPNFDTTFRLHVRVPPVAVPTLSAWAMLALLLLVGGSAFVTRRGGRPAG
ncbi:MAG: hypothetical protein H2060_00155 [Azoarcus sp.]|nr:hypothetical protein [Azoarcus sp.]